MRVKFQRKDIETGLGRKFHVIVAGTTNGAHQPIVEEFKRGGQTEVTSPGECDYFLVFCPVVSRVGTDISEALDRVPAGKKAVLVVMHYTFDCHHVIAPSSRLVENPNVLLTLDCLFNVSKLLSCNLNKEMWREVYNFLGVSQKCLWRICSRWMKNMCICTCSVFLRAVALSGTFITLNYFIRNEIVVLSIIAVIVLLTVICTAM